MRALLLLLVVACRPQGSDRDGTFVGNPGKMDVGVSGVHPELDLGSATFVAESLHLEACDGTGALIDLGTFDALGGRDDALEIPGGEFCRATLNPAATDPLVVTGLTGTGNYFVLSLDPGQLVMPELFRVDGDELLWDLPLDALDPAAIDALGSGPDIAADDPLALEVATELAEASALWEDADGNGLLDQGDFLLGYVDPSRGADAYASADAVGGCSCATGSGPAPTLPLLAFVLLSRRSRR